MNIWLEYEKELQKIIENVPKTDNINLTSAYNSINVEDLADAVDRFKKLPTYDELLKENKKYKEVIDKLIKYLQEKYDSSSLCGIVLNFTEFEDIKDILKEVSE